MSTRKAAGVLSDDLIARLLTFRTERDWEQFHTPKNLAVAISVEAGELLEQFQWTVDTRPARPTDDGLARIGDEIADVAILLTYLAHDLGIDIDLAVNAKLARNAQRYPVDKSRGTAVKYDRL